MNEFFTDAASTARDFASQARMPSRDQVVNAIENNYEGVKSGIQTASRTSYNYVRRNPYVSVAVLAGAIGLGYLAYRLLSDSESSELTTSEEDLA